MKKLYQISPVIFMLMLSLTLSGQNFGVSIQIDQQPTSCSSTDAELSAYVYGGVAPFTYEWSSEGQVISNNKSVSNVGRGYYQVRVYDNTGNFAYDSIAFSTGYVYFEGNSANCPSADGSVTATPVGTFASPVSYAWSNGATTATVSGLAAGTHLTLEVTDNNGCPLIFYGQQGQNTVGEYDVNANVSFSLNISALAAHCSDTDGSATINVTGGTGPFTYLWNTSPVQTTATASNLKSGSYTVKVTDANGCASNIYNYVPSNTGNLNASISGTDELCKQQNASASVEVSGGTSPYTITWSNEDVGASISNVSSGYYSATIEDAAGCIIHRNIFLKKLTPISITTTEIVTDCNNQNGGVDLTVSGGTSPYSYSWSNNATAEDISGLSYGFYWVNVEDAQGCTAWAYKHVNSDPACQGTIVGKVYQDDNGNCAYDSGEPELRDKYLYAYSSNNSYGHSAKTDANGNFQLLYPYSGTYNVYNYPYSPYYSSQCPGVNQSVTVTSPNSATVNFGMVPTQSGPDLVTEIYSLPPRPGFTHQYTLTVWNQGTTALTTGYIDVQLGAIESLMSYSVTPISYDAVNKIVRFPLSYLNVSENVTINFACKIEPTVTLGTTFNVIAISYPLSGDLNEESNTMVREQTVVGSYDPNDIQSFKEGDLILNEDTALTYHIRFQNTGTFYAEFVIVRDTLEEDLDVNTLRQVVTSHPVNVTILPGNIVEFAFENIYLQDSTTNEPESHGFITYKINLKEGLAYGDEIKNSAAIYFDYNPPVLTNKAKNIIATPTGTIEKNATEQKAWAYPNPARDLVKFTFDTEVQTLELMNAAGQVVSKQQVNASAIEVNTPSSKGFYYYKATDNAGNSYSGKLVVE